MTFDDFVGTRFASLLKFAVVLCGSRESAEDLTGSALDRARRRWDKISDSGAPSVAVRTSIVRSYLSGTARMAKGTGLNQPSLMTEIRRRGWEDLAARLAALPNRQRAVLVLRHYVGMDEDDIAETIGGVTAQSVRTSLSRAQAAVLGDQSFTGSGHTLDDAAGLLHVIGDHSQRYADTVAKRVAGSRVSTPDVLAEHPRGRLRSAPPPADDAGDGSVALVVTGDDQDASPPARSRRNRLILVGVVVAVALLALGVVLFTVLRDPSSGTPHATNSFGTAGTSVARTPSPHTTPSSAPVSPAPTSLTPELVSPVGDLLPGSSVLGQYAGHGPTIVATGVQQARPGDELTLLAVCSGARQATFATVVAGCEGTAVGGVLDPASAASIRVQANADTTWRFALVEEPQHGTNAALEHPVPAVIDAPNGPGVIGYGAGSGAGTVPLTRGISGRTTADVRLLLVCHGSGVSVSSSDAQFNGAYTTTCFPGWAYDWEIPRAHMPGLLHVSARAGTTWELVVVAS